MRGWILDTHNSTTCHAETPYATCINYTLACVDNLPHHASLGTISTALTWHHSMLLSATH
eukprot:11849072-Karenia_brevis.AAC.1